MTTPPANISVTLPVSQALDRVKRVLFQPFDPGKWFVIGFCAWLAHLAEGSGFNFHGPGGGGDGWHSGDFRHEFDHAKEYILNNLYWIVPVAIAFAVFCLALWWLLTWLSSRGRFMFVHCVALDKAEVVVPWRKFAREGNSLFWFRIVLGLAGLVLMVPLLAATGVVTFGLLARGGLLVPSILGLIGLVLVVAAMGIVFFLIAKLTTDFVVPIMYRQRHGCWTSWGILLGLLKANVSVFILWLLFQIVLGLAIGVLVFTVVLVTCCCAGCLFALPYLGTVFLLPVLMFKRCYSLYFLAQFGPGYDAFAVAEPPTAG